MSSPPQRLRHRASFRERFWSRTSANYDGEEDASISSSAPADHAPSLPRVYVPVHAASGFAKTVKSPRAETRRTAVLATMREGVQENLTSRTGPRCDENGGPYRDDSDDEDGDDFAAPKSTPLSRLLARPGHLYIHSSTTSGGTPDQQQQSGHADDYDAFLSAARTNEYARRVLAASSTPQDQNSNLTPPAQRSSISRSPSPISEYHSRASYASSARLWNAHEQKSFPSPTSPNPTRLSPTTAAAASKSLRRQKSIRIIGQRIAEYVRPMRPDLASPTQQQYGR